MARRNFIQQFQLVESIFSGEKNMAGVIKMTWICAI
jgi:hypothetical protein